MKITRKQFLLSLTGLPLAVLGIGGYMRYLEPNWFEVTSKTIRMANLIKSIKVLHLSDFHSSEYVSYAMIEKAIDLSLAQNPDVVFLTGDYITDQLYDPYDYSRILRKLSSTVSTFACLGNHDGGLWAKGHGGYADFAKVKRLLESCDIPLLVNEKVSTTINQNSLEIVGLGDYWSGDTLPEVVLSDLDFDEEINKGKPVIVLSHNPDSKEMLKHYHWDLMLCGHTHGGQLVIPVLGNRPFLPVQDHSFPEGLLHWGSRTIHITRGVGNLHGLRFNCRPEVSVLNLVS